MILTLTPNPSIDTTIVLKDELTPGAVHRAETVTQVAGGKGINVSHTAHLADCPTLAIFPARDDDPFRRLLDATGIPTSAVPMDDFCRVNTTVADPEGVTSKLNGAGPKLSAETIASLEMEVARHAPAAEWVVFAGSLPGGVATKWYTDLIRVARRSNPTIKVAVDTSDAPLRSLSDNLAHAAPTLIKPNATELGQLTGADDDALEATAEAGDYSGIVTSARTLTGRGIEKVLVTLGGAGAVLVTNDAAWAATPPPVEKVASTVGAGDSALTGFILANKAGHSPADALRNAVAFGSAAVTLPGTTLPTPSQTDIEHTSVKHLDF